MSSRLRPSFVLRARCSIALIIIVLIGFMAASAAGSPVVYPFG